MPLKTTPKQQTFRSHQQPNKRPAPETPRQERRNKTPRTGGWLLELLELFGRTLGAVLTFLWPSRFRFEGGIGKACEQPPRQHHLPPTDGRRTRSRRGAEITANRDEDEEDGDDFDEEEGDEGLFDGLDFARDGDEKMEDAEEEEDDDDDESESDDKELGEGDEPTIEEEEE
ncbi:hypothetical protein BC936DRAFT_150087, partial [Jimgerdemannia flammicorona]